MGTSNPKSARRLGGLLFAAHQVARQAANQAMRDQGIELRDLGVLELLAGEEPMTQQQIGERLGIDKSAMVRVVDDLEREALVARRRREDDRRAYAVTITQAGLRRMEPAYARAEEAMDRLLSGFSTADRNALIELLERLVEAGAGSRPQQSIRTRRTPRLSTP